MTENEVNRAWYGIEKTLQRLGLLDGKLSIDTGHLVMYKTIHCPDMLPWDGNMESIDEEDPEQMDALHEIKGLELTGNLIDILSRLYAKPAKRKGP